MPRGLVKPNDRQVNYVAARGNGKLYLALLNQSHRALDATLALDAKRLGLAAGRSYKARVWRDNQPAEAVTVSDDRVSVPLSADGITALAIDGIEPRLTFQDKVFDASVGAMSPDSRMTVEWPLGKISGMLLSFGRGLTTAYIYLTADEKQLKSARLAYRLAGGDWQDMTDNAYPFEFTIPLDAANSLEFRVEGTKVDGAVEHSTAGRLKR